MNMAEQPRDYLAQLLEDQLFRSAKLYEVSKALHQKDYSLSDILQMVLAAAVELSKAAYGALGVFEKDGPRLAQFLTVGMDEAARRTIGSLPVGRGLLGRLDQAHHVIRLKDLTQHPAFTGFPPNHPPMHSFLGVPIRVHDQLFGRIYLAEKDAGEEFTQQDEQTIAALAVHAGLAIETALLLTNVEATQSQYRALLDSTSEGIYGVDLEGRCTFINRAGATLLRYRPEEVIGQVMHDLIHHSKRDGSAYRAEDCPIYAAYRTGQPCRVDDEVLWRRDGTWFSAEFSSSPLHEGETLKGAVITFSDITPRKQAEAALQRSEARLQAILDFSPAMIFLKDTEGRYLHINRRFERVFHISCDSIVGKTDHDIFPAEQAAVFRANDLTMLEAGAPLEFEEVAFHDDGPHTSIACKFPLYGTDRTPYAIGGIVTDVTARKRAEEALRESEERFRQLAGAVQDVFWIADLDLTRILYVNPAYERIWGRSCQSLYDRPESFLEAVHAEDRARVHAALRERRGEGFEQEYRILRPDGSIRWIWDRGFPIKNDAGQVYRMAGIAEDITERKLAEAVRIQLLDKVMVAQEEERQRIARELHDETEQSLASLLIGLRALKEAPTLAAMRRRADALGLIAAQSLDVLDRLVRGLRPALLDELGLPAALQRLCAEFTEAQRIRVDLHVGSLAERPLPPAMETTLYRIAQEALTNTAKHAEATAASLFVQVQASSVRMIIEDNGRGFDAESVRRTAGLAGRLGLCGMQERAAIQGGTLTIESASGRGTTVYVEMPLP